eukprot:scaffold17768_cov56-Isochrysis_galbana.AAC.1
MPLLNLPTPSLFFASLLSLGHRATHPALLALRLSLGHRAHPPCSSSVVSIFRPPSPPTLPFFRRVYL